MNILNTYIEAFGSLRTDKSSHRWPARTKHQAPHKPLLLMAVIDAIADGTVATNLIELSPELGELFTLYWGQVMPPDKRGDIALPFFHLQGDGFWHLLPRPGKEQIIEAGVRLRSIAQIQETSLGARLDDDLYDLLTVADSREQLRLILIHTYFRTELHTDLLMQSVVNEQASLYSRYLLEQADRALLREVVRSDGDQANKVRDQGFRRAIVRAYDHRCGFCHIRLLTADGHTAVDAAHIIPWSETQDDRPQNGIALCKLCHWSFDEGLLTLSSSYRIKASPQVQRGENHPGHLLALAGRELLGPDRRDLWPDLHAIHWHSHHIFRRF